MIRHHDHRWMGTHPWHPRGLLLLLPLLVLAFVPGTLRAEPIEPDSVRETIERVADWQLGALGSPHLRGWVIAPFYDGLIATGLATGDPKYLAAVLEFGNAARWMPGKLVYHADDHAVGHAWLNVYRMDPSREERLEPLRDRFDHILAHPITEDIAMDRKPETPGVSTHDRWTWCDALYMAPPTLVRLAAATGDDRYLDFLDQEYGRTHRTLYDPEEHLFFRDARFIEQRTARGKKIFWSRGNGWVYAGLPMVIDLLPKERRQKYVDLFRDMSPAILAAQQPDGFWSPSLADPKQIPIGETSGTAFFVYGMAWGVRQSILNRETYWPAVERGWAALTTHIGADGAVGYVQKIGEEPEALGENSRNLYGTGGVLLAGSEILRTLGAASEKPPSELLKEAEKLTSRDGPPRDQDPPARDSH